MVVAIFLPSPNVKLVKKKRRRTITRIRRKSVSVDFLSLNSNKNSITKLIIVSNRIHLIWIRQFIKQHNRCTESMRYDRLNKWVQSPEEKKKSYRKCGAAGDEERKKEKIHSFRHLFTWERFHELIHLAAAVMADTVHTRTARIVAHKFTKTEAFFCLCFPSLRLHFVHRHSCVFRSMLTLLIENLSDCTKP